MTAYFKMLINGILVTTLSTEIVVRFLFRKYIPLRKSEKFLINVTFKLILIFTLCQATEKRDNEEDDFYIYGFLHQPQIFTFRNQFIK